MIEFCGEFSEESKNYLLKKNAIVGFMASTAASVIFGTIIIIIAAVYDIWIITLFIIVLILSIILAAASPYMQKKKTLSMLIPKKISIDEEDERIYLDLQKVSISKSLSSVKKVIDDGEWYYIKFYFPKLDGFLCQKNLITKGSLEEFEKLFEGKIEKTRL